MTNKGGMVLCIYMVLWGVSVQTRGSMPAELWAEGVSGTSALLSWSAVPDAESYRVETYRLDEGFVLREELPDSWLGDRGCFEIYHTPTVPGGMALTDGDFLGSASGAADCVLLYPSEENRSWRFSLASPSFQPSSLNYIGVVLMSDAALSGDIVTNSFHGYYLRIGNNGDDDPILLFRSTGIGKELVGSFPSSPSFGLEGLAAGLCVEVTRSEGGDWSLRCAEGFRVVADTGMTPCGTLVDASYSHSSFFGVFTHASSANSSCRIYVDHLDLGARNYVAEGCGEALGTTLALGGLMAGGAYVCHIEPEGGAFQRGAVIALQSGHDGCADMRVSQVTERGFYMQWEPMAGVINYTVRLIEVSEAFSSSRALRSPHWVGDMDAFMVSTVPHLPGGYGEVDGPFLATVPGVGDAMLMTPCSETREWFLSLGTPDFDPSDLNYVGVVLMASQAVVGDIAEADFLGYYLKFGDSGEGDRIELWRRDGTDSLCVGTFTQSVRFGHGGLCDGLQVHVTRTDGGVFRLWTSSGFKPIGGTVHYGGVLHDATYDASSYMGVYTHFSSPSASRRLYVDHLTACSGVARELSPLSGEMCGTMVSGLEPGRAYLWSVVPSVGWGDVPIGGMGLAETAGGEDFAKPTLFMFR